MYFVHLSQEVDKFLSKLDKHIRYRIKDRLKKLGAKPIPSDSKFIQRDGTDMIFRYRIGEYRALYKIKHKEGIVLIAKIDKRSKVYD